MSAFNRKTADFTKFKAHIQKKNEREALNACLAPFYNEYIFRKLKLGSYMRRQITDARTCSRMWNTDTNAASNIWKIAMSAIRGDARPDYLTPDRVSLSGRSVGATQA
jgi:hypothetical protein